MRKLFGAAGAKPYRLWEILHIKICLRSVLLVYLGWRFKNVTSGTWSLSLFFSSLFCSTVQSIMAAVLLFAGGIDTEFLRREARKFAPWLRAFGLANGALAVATIPVVPTGGWQEQSCRQSRRCRFAAAHRQGWRTGIPILGGDSMAVEVCRPPHTRGPALPTTVRVPSRATRSQKSARFPDSVANCITSSRAFQGSGIAPAEPSGWNSKIKSLLGSKRGQAGKPAPFGSPVLAKLTQ